MIKIEKEEIECDIAVVGAGGAALMAARTTLDIDPRIKVVLINKDNGPIRSHTGAAQGGVAAVLDTSKGDSIEEHIFDTVKGGDYLGNQDAIRVLCENAPRVVGKLGDWGANFSRTENGEIAQRAFGGHSFNRTCYAQDKTGHVMLQALYEQALKMGIEIYSEWYVVSLIVKDNICHGVVAYDLNEGKLKVIHAKAVILATGGHGRAFFITSNAYASTGDGAAMAYRVGMPLGDMGLMQFHPTGLYKKGVLVTEAARGEGGWLLNALGERFMARYAPAKMELAPRDVVSRGIQREILEGRGCGPNKDHVLLSIVHLGEKEIAKKLPQIREITKDLAGIDPVFEPIPIQPTAHYSMGGVLVDLNDMVVGTKGAFAIGECKYPAEQGANRLGSNSLLQLLVDGEIVGKSVAEYVKNSQLHPIPGDVLESIENDVNAILNCSGPERVADIKLILQKTMSAYCGIFRNKRELELALGIIRELKQRFCHIKISDKTATFNMALVKALETRNLLTISEVMAADALAREESRGSHYRTDFPERDDDKWLKHTIARLGKDGKPEFSYKPVVILEHKPQARTY